MMHLTECWIPLQATEPQTKTVAGNSNLFVDDLLGISGTEMEQRVLAGLGKDFQLGSEDWNDVTFTGQTVRWINDSQSGSYIDKAIDELEEIPVERKTKDDLHRTRNAHELVTEQDTISVLLQILQM